jgi:GT2 family glycosyltransferase
VFPLVSEILETKKLVVYDSQNVEGLLRAQLLDNSNPVEAGLLRDVVRAEYRLGLRAELILTCSQEDLELYARIYEWPADKMRVVPNGVMSSRIGPATSEERALTKKELGLSVDRQVAVFIGSDYAPNVEAAEFIVRILAPRLPECHFVVVGGVGGRLDVVPPSNVTVTGLVDEERKLAWLRGSDLALNPVFSGSGTNIKMFDYLAAGLPVVTTRTGARGINTGGQQPLVMVDDDADSFANSIRGLISDHEDLRRRSFHARACVEDAYSWEKISPQLGCLLDQWHESRGRPGPFFSVVIPTFDRHELLDESLACLRSQNERDFEVVIVDQTPVLWPRRNEDFGFPMKYIHSTVKGAARARNTGAFHARGAVLAFTDDDCRPTPSWLRAARPYFASPDTQAVEGLIESDHHDDPLFRPVTNVGFEGYGFMTANLLVRARTFHRLGGFDLDFDRPHFREDTDLGWRLQEHGAVPFARDVRVFHPAQPRSCPRESAVERARFFEKDALLFRKHPEKYHRLFMAEGHWKNTEGFWENFRRGSQKYGVDISEFETHFGSGELNAIPYKLLA